MEERRERSRGAIERRVEERGVGGVEREPEAERKGCRPERHAREAAPGEQPEHHRGERVAPSEQRGDRRSAVEGELPEHGLHGERDAGAEREQHAELS